MFYSRIYEKLVGKQRGVDVPLFAPIDFNERLLGFRGLLDWAHDFKICPSRVGRRELERIFVTVHSEPTIDGSTSPRRKFESKITYNEFLDLLAYCGDAGEPMDRSRLDGSRARTSESRLDKLKRLASFLSLSSAKKVRLALHNAYRDVHFWKLSDGADFEKEARAAEMRSRPQWRVELIPAARRLDPAGADAAACKYLQRFTWLPGEQTWEEFEVPALDMGTSFINGAVKRFRLLLTNRELSLFYVKLEVRSGGPLRLPWQDSALGPGQSIEVLLDVVPVECGEWFGELAVSASWAGDGKAFQETVIPTYMRILQPQTAAAEVATRLPWHAPRPFRPGSARRIIVDPESLTSRQLRPPTPHRTSSRSSRPASRLGSTRPNSAFSGRGSSLRPPRLPGSSRPGSGFGGVLSGRTASQEPQPRARSRQARPHSAPSASPEKLRPGATDGDEPGAVAAGSAIAAVRARPHSASLARRRSLQRN